MSNQSKICEPAQEYVFFVHKLTNNNKKKAFTVLAWKSTHLAAMSLRPQLLMNSSPEIKDHTHESWPVYSPRGSASIWNSGTRTLPVKIPVAERSHWDGKRLPNWIEGVLHHLRLMADGEP